MSLSESEYKVMFWNARGVRNKLFELSNLITEDNLDIICVNETFLDQGTNIPSLPGYNVVRFDKTNHSGGLLFIIKESINYTEIDCRPMQLFEYAAIKIIQPSPITIFLVYCPGGTGDQRSISYNFETELLDMCRSSPPFFVVGDFNAKLVGFCTTS